EYPRVRAVRYSAESLHAGAESHRIDGTSIMVTGIAKTVADCFKFRNWIGLDVALDALREARSSGRLDLDELWRFARIDRVANVMRPYLEIIA
ncbi:MAG TPA: hypothetical protein VG897_02850, partial [Terriglobales bacterium]|nr:hypothetical protein [Terriglobales bacterium]